MICHGVPSLSVWKKCVSKWGKFDDLNFKDKRIGWQQPLAYIIANGHRKSLRKFMLLYMGNIISRPSCYKCPFAKSERVSDITLGDHWGVPNSFFDKNGVSLVITNTLKGEELFSKASKDLITCKREPYECMQLSLEKPVASNRYRPIFWKLFTINSDVAILVFDCIIVISKMKSKIVKICKRLYWR